MKIEERLAGIGLSKEQLTSVTAIFTELSKEHDKAISDMKLDYTLTAAFKDSKAKDGKLIKALLDMSKISLDDTGKLIGLKEQMQSIKSSHAYLFEDDKPTGFIQVGAGGDTQGATVSKSKEWNNSDMII